MLMDRWQWHGKTSRETSQFTHETMRKAVHSQYGGTQARQCSFPRLTTGYPKLTPPSPTRTTMTTQMTMTIPTIVSPTTTTTVTPSATP